MFTALLHLTCHICFPAQLFDGVCSLSLNWRFFSEPFFFFSVKLAFVNFMSFFRL